jgi:hypothetical protein
MEVGVTDAVQRHVQRNVVAPKPISQRKLDFEHVRPRWMREMAAEALGVFFYVYPGIASQASFFLNNTEPAFGSIFQVSELFSCNFEKLSHDSGSISHNYYSHSLH